MTEPRTDRKQPIETKQNQQNQQSPQGRQQVTKTREQQPGQLRTRSSFDAANPFELMRRMTEQIFGTLMPPGVRSLARSAEAWIPAIEVFERDGKLHVTADLPGMTKDNVKVEVRGNNLIIEGERKQEKKEDREGWFMTERTYGRFDRVVPLPDDVNPDSAKATFHDGVLDLTFDLPQNQKSQSKTIPIEEKSERTP
jgi:HSP20 family protein